MDGTVSGVTTSGRRRPPGPAATSDVPQTPGSSDGAHGSAPRVGDTAGPQERPPRLDPLDQLHPLDPLEALRNGAPLSTQTQVPAAVLRAERAISQLRALLGAIVDASGGAVTLSRAQLRGPAVHTLRIIDHLDRVELLTDTPTTDAVPDPAPDDGDGPPPTAAAGGVDAGPPAGSQVPGPVVDSALMARLRRMLTEHTHADPDEVLRRAFEEMDATPEHDSDGESDAPAPDRPPEAPEARRTEQ